MASVAVQYSEFYDESAFEELLKEIGAKTESRDLRILFRNLEKRKKGVALVDFQKWVKKTQSGRMEQVRKKMRKNMQKKQIVAFLKAKPGDSISLVKKNSKSADSQKVTGEVEGAKKRENLISEPEPEKKSDTPEPSAAESEISALSGPGADFSVDMELRERTLSGCPSIGGETFPEDSDTHNMESLSMESDEVEEESESDQLLFPLDSLRTFHPKPPQPQAFLDWKTRQGYLYGLRVQKEEMKENQLPALIPVASREQFQVQTSVVAGSRRRIKTSTSISAVAFVDSGRSRVTSFATLKDKANVTGNMFTQNDGTLIESQRKVLASKASFQNLPSGTVKQNPFLKNDGGFNKRRRSKKKKTNHEC